MNEIPEVADYLRELPGFDALDEALLANCAKRVEIAYYRQGSDILKVGSENKRLHIIRTLRYTEGKKAPAARLLKIDVKTLSNKIKSYDIQL